MPEVIAAMMTGGPGNRERRRGEDAGHLRNRHQGAGVLTSI
ncbi:MAG: hypothetical protein ABI082_00680 [Dokdonella sp.]